MVIEARIILIDRNGYTLMASSNAEMFNLHLSIDFYLIVNSFLVAIEITHFNISNSSNKCTMLWRKNINSWTQIVSRQE